MIQTAMRRYGRLTGIGVAVVLLAAACGSDDDTPVETSSTVPGSTAPSSTAVGSTTAPADSTAPDPTDPPPTAPRATTATTAAPAPEPEPEPDPGPARQVALGEAFTIAIGESVGIAGESLVVTYSQFVSDNRCPFGVQCVTAGNGQIVVGVAKTGGSPASLTLNTTEGPKSGAYLSYTVTLVQLSRSASPAASVRVP